jgi:predicted membrane protein
MNATQVRRAPIAVAIPVRLVGAALLGVTAGIHLSLWQQGYRDIQWIGPLFLLSGIGAIVLALAVLLSPPRLLPWAAALGALLELGTLGGLLLSVTVGFLGFSESWDAHLARTSAVVEAVGGVILGAFALAELARSRQRRV